MYRPNYRSPNSCGGGGVDGSPGPFRSPGPFPGSGSPMLPPPLPPWGYGSPHTPSYGQRPSRPYGSGGGQSPRSSPSQGSWYGAQSPGNTSPRRGSPRFNVSPYNKSPGGGGGGNHHYQQHNARGYTSPRHPANYQVIRIGLPWAPLTPLSAILHSFVSSFNCSFLLHGNVWLCT